MIFDIEADGLLDKATKIHVMAYTRPDGSIGHTFDYDKMREILLNAKQLIGHNIILFDVPLLERLLGIKIKAQLVDTLAISWYANHKRVIHGLDSYGVEYGIPKPKIDNWDNLSKEEYAHRCVEDVKINSRLWAELKKKLKRICDNDSQISRTINYLTFKMKCAVLQHESRWKMDRELVETSLSKMKSELEGKVEELKTVMPPVEVTAKRTKPAKPYKKDGTYSVAGARWFKLLKDEGLPQDFDGEIVVKIGEKEPNPGSPAQVKDWLMSLGWKPTSFKYEKNDDGSERKIPQVRVDGEDGKELCKSVLLLSKGNEGVKVLEGMSILQHRVAILEGFLTNANNKDELIADIGGLTNTLRFKHRVLVNLPGVNKPFGKEIRGSLIAREGNELCGSDMVSLEETTKKHFMFPFDPDFVEEMSKPGFDAHLDLAKHANRITQEDIDKYFEIGKSLKGGVKVSDKGLLHHTHIGLTRKIFKAANYACVYGVGAPKLARETGLKVHEASTLIDAYWARNWAVKAACDEIKIKNVGDEMWLLNPVSKMYYSLRSKKDVFSTLNQGTGVFCFDSWIREILKLRPQLTAQFHDEIVLEVKKGHREQCKNLLKKCIGIVNEKLKLNTKLDVDVQFGDTYAEIH